MRSLELSNVSLEYPKTNLIRQKASSKDMPDDMLAAEDVSACPSLALRDLSLDVKGGESVCVVGPSGCGKSSLLRMICGLIQPSSGQVEIDGEEVLGVRRKTALVLQDFGLLPWKNVIQNAALGLKVRGVPKKERIEKARDALALVGLEDKSHVYPSALSGGMKQRLALARALSLDVDLLLLDEPMSALDALLREKMQILLYNLWQAQGYAQVLVTHSIEEAALLGQLVFVMSKSPGTVVERIENPHEITPDYRNSSEFLSICTEIRSALERGFNE